MDPFAFLVVYTLELFVFLLSLPFEFEFALLLLVFLDNDGATDGIFVGDLEGVAVGKALGPGVGVAVGKIVGLLLGDATGAGVSNWHVLSLAGVVPSCQQRPIMKGRQKRVSQQFRICIMSLWICSK